MGIFSFLQRPKSDEAARAIVRDFVLTSLLYRKEIDHGDDKQSADAGAEVAYLLLHLLDREIFSTFGASKRNQVFDRIAQAVIADYTKAVLRPETPPHMLFEVAKQMQDTLNARQQIYAKCRSLLGDEFPGVGSMAYAFCFFVHRALGRTKRNDINDILVGEMKLSDSDLRDFPGVEAALPAAVWIAIALKNVEMQKHLKYLA